MIAVYITVLQRFEYVKRCLASLRANVEFDRGEATMHIFPDYGTDMDTLRQVAAQFAFPSLEIHPLPDVRLHGCRNILRARNWIFDNLHCTHALGLDSDVVVSPFFIGLLKRAHTWTSAWDEHVLLSSIAYPAGYLPMKLHMQGALQHGWPTGTHLFLSRVAHARMRPVLDEFDARFLNCPPALRDTPTIRAWFASLMEPLPKHPEYDWALYYTQCAGVARDAAEQVATACAGMRAAFFPVNRAITIGEQGENMTPEQYNAIAATTLDPLDGDATRKIFYWTGER